MKVVRITLILLLSLGVLAAVFRKPIKAYLQVRIQARLLEYINTSPDRLYDYSVDHIDISIIGGNTALKGVKILPREGALDSLARASTGSLLEAEADSIALRGLGLYQLFVNGAIEIERILVADVRFRYLTNSAYARPDSLARKPFVLRDVFSEQLKKAHIRRVELRNIDVFTDDIHTDDPFTMRFDSAQMLLRNIYTDEEVMKGAQPFTYESLEMSAKRFVSTFIRDHTINVDAFSLNTRQAEIMLLGASFAPTRFDFYDPSKQFIRSVNAISAREVRLGGINFGSWQADGRLQVRRVDVSHPEVKISMDHRWPKPMHERPYLQGRIKGIPFPVHIDTIAARGGSVFYREVFADGKPPLILTFSEASAQFTNITNDSILWAEDPALVFSARAKFLDAGLVKVHTTFTMNDAGSPFHLVLSLDNMALSNLDPILEGQVHARMEGQLNKLAMDIRANRSGAIGDFVFDFSGLKVAFFKVKETKQGTREKKNWAVNTLVNPILKTDNRVSDPHFKGGHIAYSRPPDVSFFGLIWQCLKQGMVTTLVPGKGEKNEKDKEKEKGQKKEKK